MSRALVMSLASLGLNGGSTTAGVYVLLARTQPTPRYTTGLSSNEVEPPRSMRTQPVRFLRTGSLPASHSVSRQRAR